MLLERRYFWRVGEQQRGAHSHFMGVSSDSEPSAQTEMGTFSDFRFLIFFSAPNPPKVETGDVFSYEPNTWLYKLLKAEDGF